MLRVIIGFEYPVSFSSLSWLVAVLACREFIETEPSVANSTSFKLMSSSTDPMFDEALHAIRTGECDIGIGHFYSTDARTRCDCPEPPPGTIAEGDNICCLDFSEPYER
jgi:hypothetical protein